MNEVKGRLRSCNTVGEDCARYIFSECRRTRPEILHVDAAVAGEVQAEFWDADGEVRIPRLHVWPRGSLRSVLQNRWDAGGEVTVPSVTIDEDGNVRATPQNYWLDGKRGGYFSLLHGAQSLEIRDNPAALRDLLAYADGEYGLGSHWAWRKLPSELQVLVNCSDAELPIVRALQGRLGAVRVGWLRTRLGADNAVSVDCQQRVFTDCRGVAPQRITFDADVSDPRPVRFQDADGEVYAQHIVVGPRGCLRSAANSYWCGADEWGHGYSLLAHAEALTVRGNPGAVRDLLACVGGQSEAGAQPPGAGARIAIEGVAGCEREIGALAEHFGVIRVDGKRVLNRERRRMLASCDGHERALRLRRAGAEDGRRALEEAAAALAEKRREVQRARLRLREMGRRLGALMSVAR